ncbi:hypothetical protein HY572_04400 [Candidatus Micrarchaeota archaeon]|nr:hypothetical protein [Candidatus Micrarchaeota archaeon]
MDCVLCSEVQAVVAAGDHYWEPLPDCVNALDVFGYFGDDLDCVYLKKCPACKTYFAEYHADHFESGGAVSQRIEKIDAEKALEIIKKVMTKVEGAEWLKSKYSLAKLQKELRSLEKS